MEKVFSKDRLLKELSQCQSYEGVDPAELADKLADLAAIGATAEGGVTRFPYSAEDQEARQLFKQWMIEAGLNVREDAVGNLFGLYEGENPSLPVVMTGSHIDSVPNGGAFDGPLGCISGLLAIKALQKQEIKPKRSIELAVFVDEEGSRFNNGLFGSRCLMGEVQAEDLEAFADDEGAALIDAMNEQGYRPAQVQEVKRNPEDIYAFIELHIEQGKILENEGKNIGVVSGIAGPSWRTFTFLGNTDHAGNTPMYMRKDTVTAAAEFILEVEKLPKQYSETAVATVGKLNVFPNGTNVIAGKTDVVADVRDIDESTRDRLLDNITEKANAIAAKRELQLQVEEGIKIPPVLVPESIKNIIQNAAENNGLSTRSIPSGAGHDAMIIGKYVPFGMIFVPSHNGKSHSPEEWTSLPDCVNGVQVLKGALLKLADQ